MKNLILPFFLFFSVALFSQNLTGTWTCDDGGTYYLRQVGNELFWQGDGGSNWVNVFHGKIRGKSLAGEWADVPSGKERNSGSLVIQIISSNELRRTWSSGNFGGTRWTRTTKVTNVKPTTSPNANCENGVAGVWETSYKEMTLKQEGNRVYGTYIHKNGRIEGTLKGKVLTGNWYQSNGSGEVTFTFHDNCTRFTSRYSDKGKWYTDWKGTKK